MAIKVWIDGAGAGLLATRGARGSAFAYLPSTSADRAVSLTMPVRLESWNMDWGLAPIFEMKGEEGFRSFVVSSGDTTRLLEAIE